MGLWFLVDNIAMKALTPG